MFWPILGRGKKMATTHTHPGPFIRFASSPWNEYVSHGIRCAFPARSTILHPGDRLEHLHFVRSGDILATHYYSDEDSFRVNIIGENAVAGIFELFAPVPPKASWYCLGACECCLFTREQMERELPPFLLTNLLEQAALMGTTMIERFTQGADKRNDIRLARFLLHYVETSKSRECGDGTVTIIPSITQELSSELLGMHPVTFNRLLGQFRKRGIIGKSKKSGLEILDARALARCAEGGMSSLAQ